MNRLNWEKSSHSIRKLLHKFSEEDGFGNGAVRRVCWAFGIQHKRDIDQFFLWDGLSREIVGSIKLREDSFITRYNPKSIFKNELLKFSIPERTGIFIPSNTVGERHSDWVREYVQPSCDRGIRREAERTRLREAEQARPSDTSGINRVGIATPHGTVTVSVEPSLTSDAYRRVQEMVYRLLTDGVTIPLETSESELMSLYEENRLQRQMNEDINRRAQEVQRAMMRTMPSPRATLRYPTVSTQVFYDEYEPREYNRGLQDVPF